MCRYRTPSAAFLSCIPSPLDGRSTVQHVCHSGVPARRLHHLIFALWGRGEKHGVHTEEQMFFPWRQAGRLFPLTGVHLSYPKGKKKRRGRGGVSVRDTTNHSPPARIPHPHPGPVCAQSRQCGQTPTAVACYLISANILPPLPSLPGQRAGRRAGERPGGWATAGCSVYSMRKLNIKWRNLLWVLGLLHNSNLITDNAPKR